MKEKTPKPNRKKPNNQVLPQERYIRGADLAGFVHQNVAAVAQACKKVAADNADNPQMVQPDLHCQYYMDGAQECAKVILDLIPPVRVADLVKTLASFSNGITANIDKIAADCKVDRAFVMSYVNGARKFSDIFMVALNKPAEDTTPPQAEEGDTHG